MATKNLKQNLATHDVDNDLPANDLGAAEACSLEDAAPQVLVQVETVDALVTQDIAQEGGHDMVPEALPETAPKVVAKKTAKAPPAEEEAAPDGAQVAEAAPEVQEDFQPLHLRRRLRELLSVPERDRNDAQWDEIIELEIQLAPGNRLAGYVAGGNNARQHTARGNKPGAAGGQQGGQQGGGASAGGAGAQQKKHRPRSKNNRRPRPGGGKGGGEVAG